MIKYSLMKTGFAYFFLTVAATAAAIGIASAQDLFSPEPVSLQDTVSRRDLQNEMEYSDAYLDTVQVERKFIVNDYSMIGFEYGGSLSRMSFNPTMEQGSLLLPGTFGIYFTRYGKMFGYLPYFGFKAGVRYGHEGYKFKENKETGVTATLEGATQAVMECIEVPLMAHFHIDMLHFKVMADAGIYGGYRLSITRTGEAVNEELVHAFKDTDRRLDYGLTGGVGFALVFDPFEFHVNGSVRYGWSSLYDPDYMSKYYYRFAYPFDFMVTAGLYFQLTKRTGKGKTQLRKEAYDAVYGNPALDGAGR